MDLKYILSKVDHTCLDADATWPKIKELCDDGLRFGVASVCVPPTFVQEAARYLNGRLKVCTVVGFPNGYSFPNLKAMEAAYALLFGANEVDMVMDIGALKAGQFSSVEAEIKQVKKSCDGRPLKVIIEACLLTDAEKEIACAICAKAGADYIKTSTGFSKGGATVEDVKLLARCAPEGLKIKAAGGISSFEDAEALLAAGADRLGSSRLVPLAKELLKQ